MITHSFQAVAFVENPMETKLRSVQESLELVLDVARDRRLVLLEATVVILIVMEIVLSLVRPH